MTKQRATPNPIQKARQKKAQALLHYLLTVYGPKEVERLRREYYQGIN